MTGHQREITWLVERIAQARNDLQIARTHDFIVGGRHDFTERMRKRNEDDIEGLSMLLASWRAIAERDGRQVRLTERHQPS